MDTDISWIYKLEDEYESSTGEKVIRISDWHNEHDNLTMPLKLLSTAEKKLSKGASKYYFLDNINELKKLISKYVSRYLHVDIDTSNITITHNGTCSITLVMQALKKNNTNRILLITPVYFSVELSAQRNNICLSYYHLDIQKSPSQSIINIVNQADEQYCDAIFLTTPIFSCGIEWGEEEIKKISVELQKRSIWLIVDNTLGGLSWERGYISLMSKTFMECAVSSNKFICIESPAKKLFMNGVKHSIIFTKEKLHEDIERASDEVMGSLTSYQISTIKLIYGGDFENEIAKCAENNIKNFSRNYNLCESLLRNSDFFLPKSSVGFHSLVLHQEKNISDVDHISFVKKMIALRGVSVIPLQHFGYYKNNKFGFRINLSKHPNILARGLSSIEEFDF